MDTEHFLNEEVALDQVRSLLTEVFGGERFSKEYVNWLYRANPCGPEISVNFMRGERCLAHYAVVPQHWRDGAEILPMALSLNTAVGAECRGRGMFTRMADATYRRALDNRDIAAILGVANANSTHGFVKSLGFQLVAPLPVRMGVIVPWHGADVTEVEPTDLPETLFAPNGVAQAWTRDTLAWRLASPLTRYRLHLHESGALVSCRIIQSGVPMMIILKILAAPGTRVATGRLLAAAAKAHGTPVYLHAGFNSQAKIPGIPLPRRILPSPLNLIYRPMKASAPPVFTPASFEFLDFDAY